MSGRWNWVGAAIVAILVGTADLAGAASPVTRSLTPVPAEHAAPPPLALKDLDGRQRSLSDFADSVLLVNFWASWCAPCIKELPSMQATRERLAAGHFEVIAVNVGENRAEVEAFLTRLDVPVDFPILLDENMVVAKNWRIRALPTSYIVDRQGLARYIATGGRDFSEPKILDVIEDLMARSTMASDD